MTRPDVGTFTEAVYAQLEPVQIAEERLDYPLLRYAASLGSMFEALDFLAQNNWNVLLDINQIPDEGLPWLGQFIGVAVNTALPASDQRQQIRDHLGWQRGTLGALQRELSYILGNTPYEIRERTPDAYGLGIAVFTTAGTYEFFYDTEASYDTLYGNWRTYQIMYIQGDLDLIDQVIANQKPAALVWNVKISPGGDYWDILMHFNTYQDVLDYFPTYLEMLNWIPSGGIVTPSPIPPTSLRSKQTYLDVMYDYQNYAFMLASLKTY